MLPGDVINAEVHVKYLDPQDKANWTPALRSLIASITNGTAAVETFFEGPPVPAGHEFPYPDVIDKSGDVSVVKAYLNYLVFDKDYNPDMAKSGAIPVAIEAAEDGSNVPHQELSTTINITEPGFVYIYLSNDNPVPFDVFFDDFKVEHTQNPIVQADDYYPFGITFNSYKRENSVANKHLFNGIERQTELDLGWDLADFRSYDPAIGRWHQIDPKASERESPYVGMANNPILYMDPLGDTIRYGNYTINNFWKDTYMGRDLVKFGTKVKDFGRNMTNLFNGTSGIVVYGTGKHEGRIEMGSDRQVSRVGVLDLGNPENILSTLDLARAGGKDKDALGKFIEQFGNDHPALDLKTEQGYSVFKTSDYYTDSDGNSLVYSPFEERERGETATYYRLEVYRNNNKEIVGYGYTDIKQDELKEID